MKQFEQVEQYLVDNGYAKLKISYSENYNIANYVFDKRIETKANTNIRIRIKNSRFIYFKLYIEGRVLYSDEIKINEATIKWIYDLEYMLRFFNFK